MDGWSRKEVAMALQVKDDGFWGHITWESRGYRPDEAAEFKAQGLTPITAPGILEGVRYSSVFRRHCYGMWAVRGIRGEDRYPARIVMDVVRALGFPTREYRFMFSSYTEETKFLDGGLFYNANDQGFSGPPTLDVEGNETLRLLCHRLGIVQPRRFEDEKRAPNLARIETRFRSELMLNVLTTPTQ
jgi:hypothetical protein